MRSLGPDLAFRWHPAAVPTRHHQLSRNVRQPFSFSIPALVVLMAMGSVRMSSAAACQHHAVKHIEPCRCPLGGESKGAPCSSGRDCAHLFLLVSPVNALEIVKNILNASAGLWVGDCFIYNNSAWRLNYCVGGEVTTMFHLDRPMFLLGYLASQSRVYLIDREFGVVAYTLLLTLIEYKTLIIRGDLQKAAETLPLVPKVRLDLLAA